jgi:signal recognition particle subunit SRP54
VDVPVFAMRDTKDPSKIAKAAIKEAEVKGYNVLIVDTAGRLQIDEELMEELKVLKKEIKPHEILLVVDALTGQDAVNAAEGFNDALGIDGVIMTKMDGDSRGGAALSTKKVTGRPIKFVGMGEKMDELDEFHPERMASRILGMGDMMSLIEKAQEDYDEEQAAKLEEKIKKNKFTLEDFLEQMGQIRNMGGIAKMLDMLPGVSGNKNVNLDQSEKDFVCFEAIIQSMTKEERENPNILNASRRKRIAAGSGQSVQKINQLTKRYEESRKMMKQMMSPKGAAKMSRMFGGLKGLQ